MSLGSGALKSSSVTTTTSRSPAHADGTAAPSALTVASVAGSKSTWHLREHAHPGTRRERLLRRARQLRQRGHVRQAYNDACNSAVGAVRAPPRCGTTQEAPPTLTLPLALEAAVAMATTLRGW